VNRTVLSFVVAAALAASCSNQPRQAETPAGAESSAPSTPESPHSATTGTPAPASTPASGGLVGTVAETMDAGGYTYVRLETASGEAWAAGPGTPVAVGQTVQVSNPQAMPGFHSPTLDRTFETIYFGSALVGVAAGDGAASADPGAEILPTGSSAAPAGASVAGAVERAAGGQTVEELIVGKDAWVGKEILLRAEVVKFTPEVMGKNWLHVQDGTGGEGTNDLTITTQAKVAIGDVVLVKGKLVADKDFGYGYKYALIVEDAEVTKP